MAIRLRWITGSLLSCVLFLGLSSGALAQGYHVDTYQHLGQNPGNLNQDLEVPPANVWSPTGWTEVYRYSQNTPASISGMSRGIPLPPGFAFRFNGQPVTAIRAFSGGFITFDTVQTAITFINNYLPNPQAPNGFVWLGYTFSANSTANTRIMVKTFGSAPHRQVWVQWNNGTQATSNGTTGPLLAFGSIVLEETTNRIHCVAQRMYWWRNLARMSLGIGLQLNGTTAWVMDSLHSRYDNQNDPRPIDNLTFTFEPGPRRSFDAAVGAVRVPAVLPSAAGAPPTSIRAMVMNRGTQPLTGWQVAYQIGSGPVQQTPGGGPLAPGDTALVTFPTGWARPTPGDQRLKLWVQTAATQPDGLSANDTLATTVQVATREVPRRVVQELATSSSCPPCAIFDDSLRAHNRRSPHDPVELIAYPMNFPGAGDPYYLPEFRTRAQTNTSNIRNVILLNQLGAPEMVMAGATVTDPTNRFFSPPLPPYASMVQAAALPPAPLALTGTIRVGGDSVRGTITIDPVVAIPAREYSLLVVITERRTTANATTNGQTEFHNVAKKIVLTRLLMAPLVPGQPLTVPYQHVFAAGHTVEHMDSLEVVAFVQHTMPMASSAPAVVVQAVRLRQASVLGQPAAAAVSPLTLAPNPATGTTTVRFSLASPDRPSIDVLDALGRLVLRVPPMALLAGSHAVPLALAGMQPGWYYVRLTAGGTTQVRRLVVE
jgi:hypothetical protein